MPFLLRIYKAKESYTFVAYDSKKQKTNTKEAQQVKNLNCVQLLTFKNAKNYYGYLNICHPSLPTLL
jgi:hypothetical protein